MLGFECLVPEQCSKKVANSNCIGGICRCESGYLQFRRHTCLTGNFSYVYTYFSFIKTIFMKFMIFKLILIGKLTYCLKNLLNNYYKMNNKKQRIKYVNDRNGRNNEF